MPRFLAILGRGCAVAALAPAIPVPEDAAKLLVVSTRGGKADVWLVNPDGSEAKNLTAGKGTKLGGVNSYATWTPDGKQLTFHSSAGPGGGAYYAMGPDGGNLKVLLKGEPQVEGGRPAWKPR